MVLRAAWGAIAVVLLVTTVWPTVAPAQTPTDTARVVETVLERVQAEHPRYPLYVRTTTRASQLLDEAVKRGLVSLLPSGVPVCPWSDEPEESAKTGLYIDVLGLELEAAQAHLRLETRCRVTGKRSHGFASVREFVLEPVEDRWRVVEAEVISIT